MPPHACSPTPYPTPADNVPVGDFMPTLLNKTWHVQGLSDWFGTRLRGTGDSLWDPCPVFCLVKEPRQRKSGETLLNRDAAACCSAGCAVLLWSGMLPAGGE